MGEWVVDPLAAFCERCQATPAKLQHTGTIRTIVGMEIVDPHTIRFKTDGVNPYLPDDFTEVIIVSKKAAEGATTEDFNSGLGLDRPLWEQYFVFLGAVLQGEFGHSFIYDEPAIKLILQRLPATLELAFAALVIATVASLPLGIWAGLKPRSVAGRAIMAGSILGFSLPSFWVGLMLIMVFSIMLGWLPTIGRGETVEVLGIGLSILTWDGLRHNFVVDVLYSIIDPRVRLAGSGE